MIFHHAETLIEREAATREEIDALVWVRDQIDSRTIAVDMFRWRIPTNPDDCECGTPCCIGGWMSRRLRLTDPQDDQLFHRNCFDCLFFPNLATDYAWARIKMRHASEAITNFLVDGDPRWEAIVRTAVV